MELLRHLSIITVERRYSKIPIIRTQIAVADESIRILTKSFSEYTTYVIRDVFKFH